MAETQVKAVKRFSYGTVQAGKKKEKQWVLMFGEELLLRKDLVNEITTLALAGGLDQPRKTTDGACDGEGSVWQAAASALAALQLLQNVIGHSMDNVSSTSLGVQLPLRHGHLVTDEKRCYTADHQNDDGFCVGYIFAN